ncbi:FAD assembly factor SdhE [Belnapia rosea]|uniref:FAD assembly factor SdhE n=1 Tax=Belnapia rosea TaxID=938405 RepID=UPI001FDECE39|nr:succinate dehydrogenase assembly factor 2 [Belnapia rosea]
MKKKVEDTRATDRLRHAFGDLRPYPRQAAQGREQGGKIGLFRIHRVEPPMRLPRRADRIPMRLYMPAPRPDSDMPSDPSATEPTELDPRRRRLLFRARHRGTKEADLMIGAFVERLVAGFTEAELDELEAVLEYPDVDLADWLSGRRPIPAECRTPMLDRMAIECAGKGAGLPEALRRP